MDNWFRLPPDVVAIPTVTPQSETIDWSQQIGGFPEIWKKNRGKGVKAAVIDTGVDANHPDLRDAIVKYDVFTGDGERDLNGHGTWCCSMVGARTNGNGVVGIMPECQLYVYKALSNSGSGREDWIANAIDAAIADGVHLMSMSFGGPVMGPTVQARLRKAEQRNIFLFAATGNDGGRVNDPAGFSSTIGVGAADKNGRLTNFTSRGPELDIVAPGVDMIGAAPGGGYQEMTGTSMATPYAAGVGGLCLAKHRDQGGETPVDSTEAMRRHLQMTGTKMKSGYTLISPQTALKEIEAEEPAHPVERPVAITFEFGDGKVIRYRREQ